MRLILFSGVSLGDVQLSLSFTHIHTHAHTERHTQTHTLSLSLSVLCFAIIMINKITKLPNSLGILRTTVSVSLIADVVALLPHDKNVVNFILVLGPFCVASECFPCV